MGKANVKYLLEEHDRYFYQRKVPLDLQLIVGRKKWRAPLGPDLESALVKLHALKGQHDVLIDELEDPAARQSLKTTTRRSIELERSNKSVKEDQAYDAWCRANGVKTDTEEFAEAFPDIAAHPWKEAQGLVSGVDSERSGHLPPNAEFIEHMQKVFRHIATLSEDNRPQVTLAPFDVYKELVAGLPADIQSTVKFETRLPEQMDDDECFDRLTEIYKACFGSTVLPPDNPEERDEFDFSKMALERKIARVARDPDTLSKVSARFYAFAQLREKTEHKYRRTVDRFTDEVGNIPIGQVTSRMLRDYRDRLKARGLLPSSIRSEFSPIMGLFSYAVDEELIEFSPMVSVKLPKERRAVEESKWLPFEVEECRRVFSAIDDVWGKPVRGLSEERREALQMAVRVLALTAMRPAEFMALRADQVDERAIRVEGGKTKSSWRVIPLHPEISDFPAWLHAGGLDAFNNSKTGDKQSDTVTVLRHNFIKLIRKKMDDPIIHQRKALYSLRSTFQNAMRRAGAPKDVRRAILGHVESGAIRHYDDGPEFELLKHWVEQSSPLS
ncbi:MAG: phage integrase SAM-like domain-containing protein [Paracoccaceae bacterium]